MSYDNTIRLFFLAWVIGILLVGFGGEQKSYDHPEDES
jgi:hypothetical protein